MKESIDVCVVAYRSEEDLPALLEDLTLMSRHEVRLHLFDNVGNPKTLTMAWNDLAAEGDAPYLAFLNTDIRISPAWDERLVRGIEKHVDAGVVMPEPVGHDWPVLSGKGDKDFSRGTVCPTPPRDAMVAISERFSSRSDDYSFGGSCNAAFYAVLMKRDFFQSLHGFDERFRFYGQDHDFQRRMLSRHGKYAVRVRGSAVWHRCAGSTTKAAERGEVDFQNELEQHGKTKDAIVSGRLKEWDLLTGEERLSIRQNPLYSKMPTHRK